MLDFVAIDFETANSYRGSPCAVGLVRVRNGQVVDQQRWLIRPPEPVDWFDDFNVWVHGIRPEMVRDAPRWNQILPDLIAYIGDDVVIAHNAGFDIGVLRYACAVDNIEWPELRFLCTMVMARRALSLPSNSLPFVVEAVGAIMGNHHDPLADARGVVDVICGFAAMHSAKSLEELSEAVQVRIGHMSAGVYKGSVSLVSGGSGALVRPDVNPDADPEGYLYNRVVVFTGKLMAMTRQIAWEECARVGAAPDPNTTKRTNVLVIGDLNPASLRPGESLSEKARRAFELKDKGQDIEVMTEDDFMRCLEGKSPDGVEILLTGNVADSVSASTPHALRSVPLGQRAAPRPAKEPRPLRREPSATDQTCSVEGCGQDGMFKTKTKPTWCDHHITEILNIGGLRPLESFTRPDDWRLTECLNCGTVAHYRFVYTLEKNEWNEPTCRACYWREWARRARDGQGEFARTRVVTYEEADAIAEVNGFRYLGPLTQPSLPDDPHSVECVRCGRISASRLGDIEFGCGCSR